MEKRAISYFAWVRPFIILHNIHYTHNKICETRGPIAAKVAATLFFSLVGDGSGALPDDGLMIENSEQLPRSLRQAVVKIERLHDEIPWWV